jgi:CubicO group peptidase (beta-lactamase class C family)
MTRASPVFGLRRALVFAALVVGTRGELRAQTGLSSERLAVLDAQLPALLERYHIAAVGVAVIRDGRTVWTRVYGEQGPGIPASDRTLFNVASMAKPVTAETILRLVAQGRIALDEPMAPAWADPDIAADPRRLELTPRIALSHQTGFPNWRPRCDPRSRCAPNSALTFGFEPGTRFGYSGEGYNYVARFAEKKLGKDFERLVDDYGLASIGAHRAALTARDWMRNRVAVPMDSTGRFGIPRLHPRGEWSAANNLFITVGDYAAFMIAVMNGEGLSRELAIERFRVQTTIDDQWPCMVKPASRCPDVAGMALGWFRFDYGAESIIWHGGDDWGEHGLAYFYPRTRDGFVVLINGGNGRLAELDALDLLDDHAPIASFAGTRTSPLATWFRALLEAAGSGALSRPKPR